MNNSKTWEVKNNFQFEIANIHKDPDKELQHVRNILLQNRDLKTKKEQEAFLHPDIATVTPAYVGIDKKNLTKAQKRIKKAIEEKEHIIIFGDYDVDGIAGTAILWETLNHMGAQVTPYIPSRSEEGYGLSIIGIDNVVQQNPKTSLIITVDNGIVANDAVSYANKKGIDVILTDHHTIGETLPSAYAIVHTTQVCGTGVAWIFSQEIAQYENDHLALVALATVADLVPLTGANRILLSEGLNVLRATKRPGIIALTEEAGIKQEEIGVYEIGHMLSPRLNAMGRIASAMDSLRLLCTRDGMRAKALAEKLGITNKERQDVTKSLSLHAIERVTNGTKKSKLLFVAHESYEEGVIGLVAGRLVEEFYLPSIVLSIGEKISKASARSIKGFNIIDFIRSAQHLLINAGGHPMAAGFTIETAKIGELEAYLADKLQIPESLLVRRLRIDCELPLEYVSLELFNSLQQLQPFGMGNPEPTFLSKHATVINIQTVGKERSHLKLELISKNQEVRVYAIGFGLGDMIQSIKPGQEVQIVYTIDENVWNDKKSLQLKIKDIQPQK